MHILPLQRFLLLFLLLVNSYCNSQGPTTTTAPVYFTVTRVVDGDTFYIGTEPAGEERIRLIGIDAPELHPSRYKQVGFYGKEAARYLRQLLKGNKVRLEYDVSRKDRYGRTLAYAYLQNGVFINALLIEQGYATQLTVPPNVKYASRFQALQREARSQRRGLWNKKINL